MAAFDYVALDAKGKERKGIIEGDSAKQVRQLLRDKNLMPLEITESKQKAQGKRSVHNTGFNKPLFLQRSISATELALLTRQLATLIQAALPLDETLLAVANQTDKPRIKSMLYAIRSRVLEGHSLATGLADYPKVFPELYRATVDAGEQSGHLDTVLERLADYTESRQEIQGKVRQALIYPAFLSMFAIAIVVFMMTSIVPQVVSVFEDTGQELPGLTISLIAMSDFVVDYGLFVLVLVVAAFVGFQVLLTKPAFVMKYHQVLIEAIIAEITTSNNKEVGVGLAVDGTQKDSGALPAGLSNFAGVGDLLLSVASGTSPTSLPSGLSFGLGGENSSGVRYGALLRALQTDTNTNILSTPNIVTLDNEEAELIVGQNLPFVTGSFTGTGSTNPQNPFQTIERQDVGLTLKVTPQINEGDTVQLVLEQEVSSVIPGTVEQGIATRKRSIKTSVLVDDGGILILGGLIAEEVSDTKSKVPLLGDIPLIGFLFRTENTTKTKQNLMVFLRPSILRDHKDATFVTNEKYNHLRGIESGAYNKEDGSFGLLDDAAPRLPPIEELDRSKQTTEESQVIIDSDDYSDWDDEG